MEQNDAGADAKPPAPSKVGLAYLKFMVGVLVAFMLLIVGAIESGDAASQSAGRVLLLLALVAAAYAVFELSRGLLSARGRQRAD